MPAPTLAPLRPLVEIRLYDVGEGDGVVTDRGLRWYDILAQSAGAGSVSRDLFGRRNLEYLEAATPDGRREPIGLVCRPILNLKSTRLADWQTTNGTWEERKLQAGTPRVFRLAQVSTAAGPEWRAVSRFQAPPGAHLAFSLIVPESPPDWDAATSPPFVRVEFGAIWGVELRPGLGAALMKLVAGQWVAVAELPEPPKGPHGFTDEILVYVRFLRGKLLVSLDGGRSYTAYSEPRGAAVHTEWAAVTLRGQGSRCYFGYHQIEYRSGTFTSYEKNTFTARVSPASSFTGSRYLTPYTTSVALDDVSTPLERVARWRATLTPQFRAGSPWVYYDTPELYSVLFRYPVVRQAPLLTYTTPWAGRVTRVEIDKPPRMGEGGASFEVQLPAGTAFSGNYRERKVEIRLGFRSAAGADTWTTVFVGYIVGVHPDWTDGYGRQVVRFSCNNRSHVLRKAEWEPLDVMPLGGYGTLNDCGDFILETEGLTTADRSWHANGAAAPIEAGAPENPGELIKPTEDKWTTLTRLFACRNLEVAVTDGGLLQTLPRDYVAPTVTHSYRAASTSDVEQILQAISNPVDYEESATAALVWGQTEWGEWVLAWNADQDAEQTKTSARFVGKRRVLQEEVSGSVTPAQLQLRAQALALEHFPLKYEPRAVTFTKLDLGRRDRVAIYGCASIGIPDGAHHVVLGIKQVWDLAPDAPVADLKTCASIRRL